MNQCDGCQRGLPIQPMRVAGLPDRGVLHHIDDEGLSVMICTASNYIEQRREQAWLMDSPEDEAWIELERDIERRQKAARECGVDNEDHRAEEQ